MNCGFSYQVTLRYYVIVSLYERTNPSSDLGSSSETNRSTFHLFSESVGTSVFTHIVKIYRDHKSSSAVTSMHYNPHPISLPAIHCLYSRPVLQEKYVRTSCPSLLRASVLHLEELPQPFLPSDPAPAFLLLDTSPHLLCRSGSVRRPCPHGGCASCSGSRAQKSH